MEQLCIGKALRAGIVATKAMKSGYQSSSEQAWLVRLSALASSGLATQALRVRQQLVQTKYRAGEVKIMRRCESLVDFGGSRK
jgi:hypothetical protein